MALTPRPILVHPAAAWGSVTTAPAACYPAWRLRPAQVSSLPNTAKRHAPSLIARPSAMWSRHRADVPASPGTSGAILAKVTGPLASRSAASRNADRMTNVSGPPVRWAFCPRGLVRHCRDHLVHYVGCLDPRKSYRPASESASLGDSRCQPNSSRPLGRARLRTCRTTTGAGSCRRV
jgi:hypothetical protein